MTDCKPFGTSGIRPDFNHLRRANAVDAKEHAWESGIQWCGVTINVFERTEISSKVLWPGSSGKLQNRKTTEPLWRSNAMHQVRWLSRHDETINSETRSLLHWR